MPEEEDNLILRAVEGDPAAFGDLYDRYHPQIYRFIYLKIGRREESEDLTHQVFLSAWEHVREYTHRGHPFGSWLYRIARNSVIDHYRSRRDVLPLEEMDGEMFRSEENIEEAAALSMLLADVREALRKLKPDHQDIIILRFVEELSVREAAHALGRSEGAVKLLQHRAMRELQKHLRQPVTILGDPELTTEQPWK